MSGQAKIELDYGDFSKALATNDFVTANTVYSTGGNSIKSDGSIRTIKGFSVSTLNMGNKHLRNDRIKGVLKLCTL